MRTPQVPQHVQAMVNVKIAQCLDMATARYGRVFERPAVEYNVRGRTAGYAYYKENRIRLNPVLLLENLNEFLADTVVHETAHLVTEIVYPEAHQRVQRSAYAQTRGKRQPHGPLWQEVMRAMGGNPKRCHDYDTTNAVQRKSTTRQVQCVKCNKSYFLGGKRAQRLATDPNSMWCRCGGKGVGILKFVDAAAAPVVAKVQSTTKTKYTMCLEIWIANRYSASSKELLTMFIERAGCTKAGAQTYLSKLRSLY